MKGAFCDGVMSRVGRRSVTAYHQTGVPFAIAQGRSGASGVAIFLLVIVLIPYNPVQDALERPPPVFAILNDPTCG